MMRMQDKVVLITGGAAGIGKATAERFAAEGAKVAICDLNAEVGEQTVQALGPDASYRTVNVVDRAAVQAWVDDMMARYGRIDVLINNAGIVRDHQLVRVKEGEPLREMPEADFDLVIAVNLKGVYNCTQAVAPIMIAQKSGAIVSASSVVGLDGNFGQTNYVATKAAVVGMTKVWARELGRYNIRVNAIAPGFIGTDILASMPEKVLAGMTAHTPLRRMGQPSEVANAYLFLASDEASFISGATLRVDGGVVVGT